MASAQKSETTEADEGLFTFTVDLNGTEFPGASQLFFRVEED